jgi:hypothetical protein
MHVFGPNGRRPKAGMRYHAASRQAGELAGESDRVAFHGDVEISRGLVEKEVSQRTADEVERQAFAVPESDEPVEKSAHGSGQTLSQFTDKVWFFHRCQSYCRLSP